MLNIRGLMLTLTALVAVANCGPKTAGAPKAGEPTVTYNTTWKGMWKITSEPSGANLQIQIITQNLDKPTELSLTTPHEEDMGTDGFPTGSEVNGKRFKQTWKFVVSMPGHKTAYREIPAEEMPQTVHFVLEPES